MQRTASLQRLYRTRCFGFVVKIALIISVGMLWLFISEALVSRLFNDPEFTVIADTLKNWSFAPLLPLLIWSISRLLAPASSAIQAHEQFPSPLASTQPPDLLRPLRTFAFAILSSAIIAFVTASIAYATHQQRTKEVALLQAVANSKLNRLTAWFWDRQEDAQFIRNDPLIATLYQRWHTQKDEISQQQLRQRLKHYQRLDAYNSVVLLDEQGQTIAATEDYLPFISEHLRAMTRQALVESQVLNTDPYRDAVKPQTVFLDFIAPLLVTGNQPSAAIVLRIDPTTILNHMIESWPFPSISGETVVFRRDGDFILYLNELKHLPGSSGQIRHPLSDTMITTRALRGEIKLGVAVDGLDYQGTPVTGLTKAIPLTDWFLTVKIDQSEVYGPAWQAAVWIVLIGLVALIAVTTGLLLFERNRTLHFSMLQRERQTEQLQAFQELAEERTRLHTLFEHSRDGIVVLNTQGHVWEVNQRYAEMLGYSPAEVLKLSVWDWDIQSSRADLLHRIANMDSAGEHFETRHQRKDGTVFDVEVVSSVVEWTGQKLIFCLHRDITERKRAENQLRKLSLAVEQSPSSVVIMDLGGRIEYTNAAFTAISGYSGAEAPAHNPYRPGSGDTPASTYAELWSRVGRGDAWEGELANRRKNGESYIEFARITPIRQADGWTTHYLAIGEDITEKNRLAIELDRYRHHLEELVQERTLELAAAKEAAETANRAKGTFLANMSHELRTPLNAVIGFSELMHREAAAGRAVLSPSQQENLVTIHRSGQHLLALINNVLDLSKIEAGRVAYHPEACDLYQLLQDLRDLFRQRSADKHLSLQVEWAAGTPPCIYTDPAKLRQVLINLLGNAIKFTAQGQIMLMVEPLAEPRPTPASHCRLRFTVADTGPGIASEEQGRLFQMFSQTLSGLKAQEGTGLGLVISQQYVHLLGGHILVDSQAGHGSRFWFDLDVEITTDPQPKFSEKCIVGLIVDRPDYRILIVDDQLINRRLLVKLLEPLGFNLQEAADGIEALQKWQQWQPDLIWLDIRMPKLDGYEVARRIRAAESDHHVKILAFTASTLGEERAQVLAAGCDGFLGKPFRHTELLEMMGHHLQLALVYADEATEKNSTRPMTVDAKRLAELPQHLLEPLRAAVLELDMEYSTALANDIAALDPILGAWLQQQLQDLRYESLIAMLDSVIPTSLPSPHNP